MLQSNPKTVTMKKMILVLIIIGIYGYCYSQAPKKAETVKLNGVETYYEVYGEGEPLFLLHGSKHTALYTPTFSNLVQNFLEISTTIPLFSVDFRGLSNDGATAQPDPWSNHCCIPGSLTVHR